MENISENWKKYIKSSKALKTLNSLINAVIEFNKEENNPFEIVRVGVGGSALRTDKPHDLDMLIFYKARERFKNDFKEFSDFLRNLSMDQDDAYLLWSLKESMMWGTQKNEFGIEIKTKLKTKITVEEYIEENRNVLLDLGFKPIWLEWLKHQKLSDFLRSGSLGFIVSFNPHSFVLIKIQENLNKRIKTDFQLYFLDRDSNEKLIIPHLVLWENGESLEIGEEEYQEYLRGEWERLLKQFLELKKMFREKDYESSFPLETYRYTIEVYWDKDNIYPNTSNEVRRYIDYLIQEGEKIIRSEEEYSIKAQKIRKILKKIRIVGYVAEKVYSSRTFRYGNLSYNLSESEMKDEVRNYILEKLPRGHITKKDLESIVKDVDFTKVLIDIKNSRGAPEDE